MDLWEIKVRPGCRESSPPVTVTVPVPSPSGPRKMAKRMGAKR
ncbi:hypothetical protein V6N12_002554, partial [Hibiscus sabdariffa]